MDASLSSADLYRTYRRRVDVRQLLAHYGARNCSEQTNRDGTTEIVHSCLLDAVEPHHAHGDEHPSAWVNVDKGLYCCALYWSGDVLHLILKLEGLAELGQIGPLLGTMLGGTRTEESFRAEVQRLLDGPSSYAVDLPSYSESVLRPWMASHPYMRNVRGVGHETCAALGIGYDRLSNRIVFPHRWRGNLVGWQKRAIPPGPGWPGTEPPWPKYKNSSGFPKSETLYRYDEALDSERVVVVESPMSVAKAHELGVFGVVATFGAKVTSQQIDLLKRWETVVVWFDADPAGESGTAKLVEGLYRHCRVLVVPAEQDRDLGDYSDANDVSLALQSATPAVLWLAQHIVGKNTYEPVRAAQRR